MTIQELVNEYNQVEKAQTERLKEIYLRMKERRGYRRVQFSSGQNWTNCWGGPERLTIPRFVEILERSIIELVEGEPAE